jgi:hypothetical protein
MTGKNARKREARKATPDTRLHSSDPGKPRKVNTMMNRTPYSVIGTSASSYSTSVAHNTTRIWRDER